MEKKNSIRVMIMVPVILLGIVSIFSNIMARWSLKNVNETASLLADQHMSAINELNAVGQKAKDIHTLALSHIVATDFETMTLVIGEIEAKEAELKNGFDELEKYSNIIDINSQKLQGDLDTLIDAIRVLLARSANQQTKSAYEAANGILAEASNALDEDIQSAILSVSQSANLERENLAKDYQISGIMIIAAVAVSALAVVVAIFIVARYVIRPIMTAEKELKDIIDGIENRQGDLTRRISVQSNDEIGALSRGINTFIEKLQTIFVMITSNSAAMDKVVTDVLGSVQTSNSSAADLSALTEELSATMQEVANNAGRINENTESVRKEVEDMADKSNELSEYSRTMKSHADNMEQAAKTNMDETNKKVEEILENLNKAIADSNSVDQVNSLTDDIMSIASQTNLLSLNASIEAARAGEAGKGFAVVAGEIGTLAENSQKTAGDIQKINSVVINAVHNLSDSANDLVSYVQTAILPEFANFVEEGEEYSKNASYIENVMQEFSGKTEGLKESFNEIAESISSITTSIQDGVRGVSSAAESTQTLVSDMDNISNRMDENQRIAIELDEETAIFTKI